MSDTTKRDEAAQKYFDVREELFDVNDFSREIICVESFKSGWDLALIHPSNEYFNLYDEVKKLKAALEKMLAEDNGGDKGWQEIAREALK